MYSVVRNPLYLANSIMWSAATLFLGIPALTVIVVLICWLYHERIILAEETFLESKFGDVFRDWAAETPAFIPSIANWKRSRLPFCWRTALLREYLGMFALVSTFSVLQLLKDSLPNRRLIVNGTALKSF